MSFKKCAKPHAKERYIAYEMMGGDARRAALVSVHLVVCQADTLREYLPAQTRLRAQDPQPPTYVGIDAGRLGRPRMPVSALAEAAVKATASAAGEKHRVFKFRHSRDLLSFVAICAAAPGTIVLEAEKVESELSFLEQ